jgi:hypothetical protein
MLLYRLRERVLQFEGGVSPRFPGHAVVNVELAPGVPFGGAAGPSRNAVTGTTMQARVNLSTGRAVVESKKPMFEPVTASIAIAGTDFEVNKNVVSVRSQCTSEQDLTDLMAAVFYAFPAVLNLYLPDAPFPTHAWGQLGKARFHWIFQPTEVVASCTVTSKENQEHLITDAWQYVAVVAPSRRLIGALYYFHVACRLLAVGHNRFEFMAEALLNLAKSLQSLFGQSRDEIRAGIEQLNFYSHSEIDGKFMPAMVLRDQFDAAHVTLSMLSREQLRTLHDYTNIAEESFRKLHKAVLTRVNGGEYVLPADSRFSLPAEKQAILRKLRKNIKPFCQ